MSDGKRNIRQNHLALAQQIIVIALERGMKPGDHLTEQSFSEACNVSRTPIRSAFQLLKERELLVWREEEGYFLADQAGADVAQALKALDEVENALTSRILSDRAERRIGDVQSISAMARRYSVSRSLVLSSLKVLAQEGIVIQLPGRAWAFQPMLDSPIAVEESFSFRLSLEPQAILAPGFTIDAKKAGFLRMQTEELLKLEERRITALSFRRIDTEFHIFVAECSGNRFLKGALVAHHRLRRVTQKDMSTPDFRLRQSLGEHLEILDSLERHDFELAADQMVLHLRRSSIRRPEMANRGSRPLMKGFRPWKKLP